MQRTLLILVSATTLLTFVPLAGAQAGTAVDGCANECLPTDPEVNGGELKTGDDTVRTILYGHFEDILNRAPLNTQLPSDKEDDLNRGYLMPVIATTTGTPADVHFENNWFYMYSSAGFVEITEGVWRTHQEPGLAEPVEIVGDTINLYFYLSAYPGNLDSDSSPTDTTMLDVMPQVGIYARIETGRFDFSPSSTLLAEGDTGGENLAAPSRTTIITSPAGPDIYEFLVPLEVKVPTWPDVNDAPGFLVSINPYQIKNGEDTGQGRDTQIMQNDWRVRVGPSTPVRLVFDVANPMTTKAASLNLYNDNMFIRWSFLSPWGSYDADDLSLNVAITGPTAVDPNLVRLVILKRSVDHDGHFKPVNATWKFDYPKAALSDGEYSIDMSIKNLQNTYELRQNLVFTVSGGVPVDLQVIGGGVADAEGQAGPQSKKTEEKGFLPGFEALPLLAAVLIVAAVVGRRRKQ